MTTVEIWRIISSWFQNILEWRKINVSSFEFGQPLYHGEELGQRSKHVVYVASWGQDVTFMASKQTKHCSSESVVKTSKHLYHPVLFITMGSNLCISLFSVIKQQGHEFQGLVIDKGVFGRSTTFCKDTCLNQILINPFKVKQLRVLGPYHWTSFHLTPACRNTIFEFASERWMSNTWKALEEEDTFLLWSSVCST